MTKIKVASLLGTSLVWKNLKPIYKQTLKRQFKIFEQIDFNHQARNSWQLSLNNNRNKKAKWKETNLTKIERILTIKSRKMNGLNKKIRIRNIKIWDFLLREMNKKKKKILKKTSSLFNKLKARWKKEFKVWIVIRQSTKIKNQKFQSKVIPSG